MTLSCPAPVPLYLAVMAVLVVVHGIPVMLLDDDATPPTPLEIVAQLDSHFNQLYNSQQFDAVQGLYHTNSLLIPPTADAFITQPALKDFFAQAYKMGIKDLHLAPITAIRQLPNKPGASIMHEIGNCTHSLQPSGGLYYVRWLDMSNGEGWKVALDIMAEGAPWPAAAHAVALERHLPTNAPISDNVTAAIQKLDDIWGTLFNAGNYDGVSALYADGSQLLPPGVTQFIDKAGIAKFLADGVAHGIANVTLTATKTLQESSTVIHEIGHVNSAVGGGPYYVRWGRTGTGDDDGWKLVTDVMSIGEGLN